MTRWRFLLLLAVVFAVGTSLRVLWLRADPPSIGAVGIVWHDEGPWVHNARNRALWGVWRTDNWNPVFVAPVFTALEYGAFEAFGVGTWQARTVPLVSGLVAVGFLVAGLSVASGRRAALIGGALLSTNYVFVMWNRAALMESTMTSFIVIAWSACALAERRPLWGAAAGTAAVLAWFTKASAAFFVAALILEAATSFVLARGSKVDVRSSRFVWWTLAGLVLAAAIIAALFVLPHWSEYRFYNWQMSVLRKPSYTVRAFVDRASWLPIVQGLFTRMWPVLLGAAIGTAGVVARWRTAKPAERLLVLWFLLGLLELVAHDSGNERRYVMFVPAVIALAAMLAGSRETLLPAGIPHGWSARALALPLLLGLGYLVLGSFLRPAFMSEIQAGSFHRVVWLSAGLSAACAAWLVWRWRGTTGWLANRRLSGTLAMALLSLMLAWDLTQYTLWASRRNDFNYRASLQVGQLLPPGTLVQGKLANGLSLENRIRPIFVGNHFGNYDDRLQRDDVRYILTYVLPSVGYESQERSGLIQEILDHYPNQRAVAFFDVDETPGVDRAELVDKFFGSPGSATSHARD